MQTNMQTLYEIYTKSKQTNIQNSYKHLHNNIKRSANKNKNYPLRKTRTIFYLSGDYRERVDRRREPENGGR